MKEISYEMAEDMGLIPSALDYSYKAAEGMLITHKSTDEFIERTYKRTKDAYRKKYQFVTLRGETLKVV